MIKKILLTVLVVLCGFGGIAMFGVEISNIIDSPNVGSIILAIIGFIITILPSWLMWKGTKLIPFITILPIRILLFIIGLLVMPIGLIFALIGIWLKS